MKNFKFSSLPGLIAVTFTVALTVLVSASAFAASTLYDMSVFLNPGTKVADSSQSTTVASDALDIQVAASQGAMTPAATGDVTKSGARRSDLSLKDGFLSEIRVGILAHDVGPFTLQTQHEDGSIDLNAEFIFHSPDFLQIIGSPRPHLGTSINTAGDTSQVYAGLSYEWYLTGNLGRRKLGLSYEWYLTGNFFVGIHGGGAVHNGETDRSTARRKNLGCSPLFRGAIEAGYRFDDHHGISLMVDHISNAYICDSNQGLESVGLRYGYRF